MLSGSHSEKADGSSTLPHSSLLFLHMHLYISVTKNTSKLSVETLISDLAEAAGTAGFGM